MDYSKMSDQQINMAVARIIYPDSEVIESKSRPPCACVTGHIPSWWVDYCNNPADAWPIIEANNIAVIPYRHTMPQAWPTAFGLTSRFTTEDEKPLRAAMIVILKLQESANVPANPAGPDLL